MGKRYRQAFLCMAVLFTACSKGGQQQTGRHQQTAEAVIDSVMSVRLTLPKGMNAWKAGKDFVWVSDDEAQTMRNICLYAYPGLTVNGDEVIRKRDSVMRLNMPGEERGMYMHTEERVPVTHKLTTWKGHPLLRSTGQWEMEGDAMGGPFVCHSRIDTARGRVIVAEAFVYAPGRDKHEVMKRLEAAILKMEIH